jgi:putative SOS response-associated peptidase YedK
VCGRYTLATPNPAELRARFPIGESIEIRRRYNVAPGDDVLAVTTDREGALRGDLLRWGLVPSWAQKPDTGLKMINARVETVASTAAYRSLIPKASRRALQVADGYFEWLKPEKRGEPRQPFFFQVDGGIPFAFASLWTPAKIDGQWLASVALLTCDSTPNRVAGAIHDRMPVILADRDAQHAWLDGKLGAEEALELCTALPAARLSAAPANPAVNKAGDAVEGPELLRAPSG